MATRKRADTRERDRRRNPQPRRKGTQPRQRASPKKLDKARADSEQNPAEQERESGERLLKDEPEQEARLQHGVEREALGVQQPLDQLLEAVGEQRQQEKAARADPAVAPPAKAGKKRPDREDGDERPDQAEPEDGVTGEPTTRTLVHAGKLTTVAVRALGGGRARCVADCMCRNRPRRHQRHRQQPGKPPSTHTDILPRAQAAIAHTVWPPRKRCTATRGPDRLRHGRD
jgi:hypothetical protein